MRPPNWECIRAHYRHNDMAIHQAGADMWGIDAYAWEHDAGISMTPIERAMWSDIRAVGAILYPQYPVGRYFVDFGSPTAKVAIECDGAAYHTDAERDAQRQREIESLGWTVYRLGGKACLSNTERTEDNAGRHRIVLGECYALIRGIAERHRIRIWSRRTHVEPYALEAA